MPYDKDPGTFLHSGKLPEMVKKIVANWPIPPAGGWNDTSIDALRQQLQELSRHSEQAGLAPLHKLVTHMGEKIHHIIDHKLPPDREQINTLNKSLERLKRVIESQPGPILARKIES